MIKKMKNSAMREIKIVIKKLEEFMKEDNETSLKLKKSHQTRSILAEREQWDDVIDLQNEIEEKQQLLLQNETQIISECEFLIHRICANGYWRRSFFEKVSISEKIGLLKSLHEAIKTGRYNFVELTRAEIFSDYLSMAEHLLEEGYKDPAAIIIGSTLEEHLRKLAQKNNISLDFTNPKGVTKLKTADTLNADLEAIKIYSKLDLKNVVAWLDLRNKAAHGHYKEYDQEQVGNFLNNVRNFIARHPA